MDLTALKGMLANRPSLTDYMGGGKNNIFETLSRHRANSPVMQQVAQKLAETSGGVRLDLSAEAQAVLATKLPDGPDYSKMSGVQKGAMDFFMSFFDQGDIDLTQLSDETLELIRGFQAVIAQSGPVQRDHVTDSMEARAQNGLREAYTLVGTGSRLRMAIDYAPGTGTPTKLSISDVLNGQVEIAEISLEKNAAGKTDGLLLERSQREYARGHLIESTTKMPVSLALYAQSAAS